MGLTGPALLIGAAVLFVAALVAVFVGWNRVRGSRWLRGGQRYALLVATQVATVLLVAVLANDAGDFFTSWDQLAGTDSARVSRFVVRADHNADAYPLPAADLPGFATADQRPQRGELAALTVRGATSGLRVPVTVYLPPQYFQQPYLAQRFPVVTVLTATDGRSDVDAAVLPYLRRLQQRSARPAVLVLVTLGSGAGSSARTCVSTSRGPQGPEFLSADLPIALSRSYRVRPLGWGVAGVGAGGYCAARMALTAPDVYYAAASIDGYFTPPQAPGPAVTHGRSGDELAALNDLVLRLRTLPSPPVQLQVVDTAAASAASRAQATAVRRLDQPPLRISGPASAGGGSAAAVQAAVAWLSEQVPPADAGR